MRAALLLLAVAGCAPAWTPPAADPSPAPAPAPSHTPLPPPADEDCLRDRITVGFAVVVLAPRNGDSFGPVEDEVVLLQDESLCGGDPGCPNALVTYAWPFRITQTSCQWLEETVCDVTSSESVQSTPEDPSERRCWRYAIEVLDAPLSPGTRGKLRLLDRPGANLDAAGDIEVLVTSR
jgi:hypothetical protein